MIESVGVLAIVAIPKVALDVGLRDEEEVPDLFFIQILWNTQVFHTF
jgi:hypothetical protein